MRTTTSTSWLNRWEALQDQHEAELARIADAAADVRPNGPPAAQAWPASAATTPPSLPA
jgi:hypothetical protein